MTDCCHPLRFLERVHVAIGTSSGWCRERAADDGTHPARMPGFVERSKSRYRIDLDGLDGESLRELQRVLRDLDHEKQAAVNRARLMPWPR